MSQLKITKFSIRAIASATAVTAFVLFWIGWPGQTAATFVDAPVQYRDDGRIANPLHHANAQAMLNDELFKGKPELIGQPRTWSDFVAGRQFFSYGVWYFSAVRGKIDIGPVNFGYPDPRYDRPNHSQDPRVDDR